MNTIVIELCFIGFVYLSISFIVIEARTEILFKRQASQTVMDLSRHSLEFIDPNRFNSVANTLIELQVRNNRLTVLVNDTFSRLTNLRNMTLARNQIHTIHIFAFRGLNNLDTLNLEDNRLTVLTNSIFSLLTRLNTINLVSNYISIIEPDAFQGLAQLNTINLNNNRIRIIETRILVFFNQLQTLSVQNNQISKIESIKSLTNLQTLNIRFNRLELVGTNSFTFLNNIALNFNGQSISRIEKNSFSGRINTIDFTNNIIVEIEQESFDNLTNLRTLSFTNNFLNTFNHDFFKYPARNLADLKIDNNKIASLTNSFEDKFPSLAILDLSLNYIKIIKNHYFANLNRLRILKLTENKITDIEVNSFEKLVRLEQLFLDINYLGHINTNLFQYLTQLNYINLKNNKLYDLSGGLFYGLNNLRTIDLGYNYLRSSLLNLTRVENLDLSNNRIDKLNFNLIGFSNLRVLNFSRNFVRRIQNEDFRYLTNLQYLDLSFNPINYLPPNLTYLHSIRTFKINDIDAELNQDYNFNLVNFPNLEELDISNNKLVVNQNSTLINNPRIRVLRLRNVNLTSLSIINFTNIPLLEEIDLSDNDVGPSIESDLSIRTYRSLRILKLRNTSTSSTILSFILNNNQHRNTLRFIDLSYNKITYLIDIEFNAEYLDLSNNLISNLSEAYFGYRICLSCLTLVMNNCLSLPNRFKQVVCRAVKCSLSNNDLYVIPVMVSRLENLDFSFNQLSIIRAETFIVVTNLKSFNLSNNNISFIEYGSFRRFPNLEDLSLAYNKLGSSFDLTMFDLLLNLNYFNLSGNQIAIIPTNSFRSLNKLKILDLSNNNILLVESNAFYDLPNLMDIFLNNNTEMRFESDSFEKLDAIKTVYLSMEVLKNETNRCRIRQSLRPRIDRDKSYREYFDSINLITTDEFDCFLTLSFIKYNMHLNLKSDLDFYKYLINNCDKIFVDDLSVFKIENCD